MADHQECLSSLSNASHVLLAGPDLVNAEERKCANDVFMMFKKMKDPLELCHFILENSKNYFVLFETVSVLMSTFIRDWDTIPPEHVSSLPNYILEYNILHEDTPPYIRQKMLQLLAVILKRGHTENFGKSLNDTLFYISNTMLKSDSPKVNLIGLHTIQAVLTEYSNTFQAADIGLTFEKHFTLKKKFEVSQLKQLFEQTVSYFTDWLSKVNGDHYDLCKVALTIIETILTWCFVSLKLPKAMIKNAEKQNLLEKPPDLKLDFSWTSIICSEKLLMFFFQLFWKFRDNEDLSSITLSCLVQLSSLHGTVLQASSDKIKYFTTYTKYCVELITSVTVRDNEAIKFGTIFQKLVCFFPSDVVQYLDKSLVKTFIKQLAQLTCDFNDRSAQEELEGNDCTEFKEAYKTTLDAWITIIRNKKGYPEDVITGAAKMVFDGFLKTHLIAAPGSRIMADYQVEVVECDEPDCVEYSEQLEIIAEMALLIPKYSLNLLATLLEDRTLLVKQQLEVKASQIGKSDQSSSNDKVIEMIYEDIHWLLLIIGHVLCYESEGEVMLIRPQLIRYSIALEHEFNSNAYNAFKVLCGETLNSGDVEENQVIRLTGSVFRLCTLENAILAANLWHILSSQISSDLTWFLSRWCQNYILPNFSNYEEMSEVFRQVFEKDTPGSNWTIDFILDKVRHNLTYYNHDSDVTIGTSTLLVMLVDIKDRKNRTVLSQRLWNFVQLPLSSFNINPSTARKDLWKALTVGAAGIPNMHTRIQYLKKVFTQVDNTIRIIAQLNFDQVYQHLEIQQTLFVTLEIIIGGIRGIRSETSQCFFEIVGSLFPALPCLINLYHNYSSMVRAIIELLSETAFYWLTHLNHTQSQGIFQSCVSIMGNYSAQNKDIFTSAVCAQEDSYYDLMMLMRLLTNVISHDIVDLTSNSTEGCFSASDVSVYGLTLILPLITEDLLLLPPLSFNYYELVASVSELYPEKILGLNTELKTYMCKYAEFGLRNCGPDVLQFILDFIKSMGHLIYSTGIETGNHFHVFVPVLWKLAVENQLDSYYVTTLGETMYVLICCYNALFHNVFMEFAQNDPEKIKYLGLCYQEFIQGIIFNNSKVNTELFKNRFETCLTKLQFCLNTK